MDTKPLQGVKVLECAHFIAGPRCAQLLADHGAEVIKLEPPSGDLSRRSAPIRHGWSMYFAAHNRGKQSVVVDLKNPQSAQILKRLIEWADVLVTNYTPAATEKLGLDYASASQVNPNIVVVRISAYGLHGSGRELPGFDGTVQARSGIAHMVGPADRPPTITSILLIDFFAAVEGAYGAMLGMHKRDLTGRGCEIDVSMMDSATTALGYLFEEVLVSGQDPMRTGSRAPYALTGTYETSDGFLYIAPIGDPAWTALCTLINRPEWAAPGSKYFDSEARLRDRDLLESAINEWTLGLTRAQAMELLRAGNVACGEVNSIRDVTQDPLLVERKLLQEVELGTDGVSVPMPGVEIKFPTNHGENDVEEFDNTPPLPVVPALGASTADVLSRIGFSEAAIDRWKSESVIV